MTDDETLRELDAKRRKREEELIALLLLWMSGVQNRLSIAMNARIASVSLASSSVNGFGNYMSIASIFTAAMVDAHTDALDTIDQLTGTTVARPSADELDILYSPAAHDASIAVADQMAAAFRQARSAVADGESVDDALAAAFIAIGYADTDSSNIARGAERSVVSASNTGLISGGLASGVVTGLVHRSVLDSHTTEICRPRDGLMLPIDDEFWRTNCPSLHWGCRSALLPIFGDFEPSEWRPPVPPDPGFGLMPVGFIEAIKGRN